MQDPGPPPQIRVRRLGREHALAAARRLVDQSLADVDQAAKRLIAAGPAHGIDFSLAWATVDEIGPGVVARQVVLAVPGRGRTVMLFISEPPPKGDAGGTERGVLERAAILKTLCSDLAREMPGSVRLAQALPSPHEAWAIDSMRSAGFLHVGDLSYMKRPISGPIRADATMDSGDAWPADIALERADTLGGRRNSDPLFTAALDASYADTLDCPELCGLRDTTDVLESHRATGAFDPKLWWLLRKDNEPVGCMLLNRCPEQRTVELVYLGLAPRVRGRGLAGMLLARGITELQRTNPGWQLTCAVDDRNTPARSLYTRHGFAAFSRRTAMVKPLGA